MTTRVETGIFNSTAVVFGKKFALDQLNQQVDNLDMQLLCPICKLATRRAYVDVSHFPSADRPPGKRNYPPCRGHLPLVPLVLMANNTSPALPCDSM